MRFSVITLGCKVNSYESEAIINNLVDHGMEYIEKPDATCDLFIVNTCTVTSTSDQKSRQMLHQVRRLNNNSIIVAVGCFVQLNQEKALELADIIIGTNHKLSVYDEVMKYLQNHQKQNNVSDVLDHPCYEEMKVSRMLTHTRAFIKIQDGCENYCSYCAIPYSRGKIRSRNPINVINEIKALVDMGVKEVILAGINTGAYGRELNNNQISDINLAKLITMIMEQTNLYRLRISSIELKEISDELLNTIIKYQDRIAHHFHIPCQAGSDAVLKRMHRKYLTQDYIEMVNRIRKAIPDVAITTDCLAGFVGETEEEYQELLSFIDTIKFYEMHIFPYSRRSNTVADSMPNHLDEGLKKQRARDLIKYQEKYTTEYINKFIGCTFEVICEDEKDGIYHGHTSNYLDIYFENPQNLQLTKQIVKVKIINYENKQIKGEIIYE